MKFRHKVLFVNIILLAIGIAFTGYFMIDKNISLALNNQIKNAINENNILQSSLEFPLLSVDTSSKYNVSSALIENANDFSDNLSFDDSETYIIFDDQMLYTNSKNISDTPYTLCEKTNIGEKKYSLVTEGKKLYIYVCSCSLFSDIKLFIINKKDLSDIQELMNTQLSYYSIIMLSIIAIDTLIMFILTIYLTKPLEKLVKVSIAFGNGDYSVRAETKSNDEIGELTNTYNSMAQSVSDHVDNLQDMIERQNQFIADFTHEIKTPMTSIIGYADALRSKEMSRENQIMSASYIFNEGKRLESMSRKLFDLIYTKDKDIEHKNINIYNLIERISDSITPALDVKDIKLICDIDDGNINGDMDLLTSSFINLVDNARKASDKGSEIYILGKKEKNSYTITIKDNGVGIAPEHVTHTIHLVISL